MSANKAGLLSPFKRSGVPSEFDGVPLAHQIAAPRVIATTSAAGNHHVLHFLGPESTGLTFSIVFFALVSAGNEDVISPTRRMLVGIFLQKIHALFDRQPFQQHGA
jgi:hypothetical protein